VRRTLALLVGLTLIGLSVTFVLYGLFAILYRGDSGGNGDTYVTFAGHEINADVAGAIALLAALVILTLGVTVVRRRGFAKPS
jgi:hypothetical protein